MPLATWQRLLWFWKFCLLIHVADPQSRLLVIIVFARVVPSYVRPQIFKQNEYQVNTMFSTGETVGLAEWIIEDTGLSFSGAMHIRDNILTFPEAAERILQNILTDDIWHSIIFTFVSKLFEYCLPICISVCSDLFNTRCITVHLHYNTSFTVANILMHHYMGICN